MKSSNSLVVSKKLPRESEVESIHTISQLKNELNHYLQGLNLKTHISGTDIKELISSFADILRKDSSSNADSQQLNNSLKRQSALVLKDKLIGEEVVKLMTYIASKEEQLAEKDDEIFHLKLTVEQKEMNIVQLKIDNVHNRKYSNVKTAQSQVVGRLNGQGHEDRSDQQEVTYMERHIGGGKSATHAASGKQVLQKSSIVNSKSSGSRQKMEEERGSRGKSSGVDSNCEEITIVNANSSVYREKIEEQDEGLSSQWAQERQRLLKLLRDKDQRIYELIQELSTPQK